MGRRNQPRSFGLNISGCARTDAEWLLLFPCCCSFFSLFVDIPYVRLSLFTSPEKLSQIYVILLFFSQMSVKRLRINNVSELLSLPSGHKWVWKTGLLSPTTFGKPFQFLSQDERSRCSFLNGLWVEFLQWQPQHPDPLNLPLCFYSLFLMKMNHVLYCQNWAVAALRQGTGP